MRFQVSSAIGKCDPPYDSSASSIFTTVISIKLGAYIHNVRQNSNETNQRPK